MEKTAPITTDSPISTGVSLKYGNTYISAPVDIMTGGINIFFIVSGRFAAFCLTMIAPMPMKTAIMEAAVNNIFSISISEPLEISKERLQPDDDLSQSVKIQQDSHQYHEHAARFHDDIRVLQHPACAGYKETQNEERHCKTEAIDDH